ncbi:ankyrin [Pleomassaria siparia CBS 279.74]|uniref:Ankyrin n=1 Tax=Pleomassaria siparia CBS 279.74 TaxID=1314801 RepID=A0A6G1KNM7_9PLEO|nr:ankyrin [Pleomassaria siparia CBS 279.74]
MSLPRYSEDMPPSYRMDDDIVYNMDTGVTMLGHKRSRMHTMLEVLRCELAKPRKTQGKNGLQPCKGWTPIYYAAYHNREAALLHFLREGQSPDDITGTGQPPLCIAVQAGHLKAVRILCEAGADIKAPMKPNGETALHLAIKAGRTDLIDILLPLEPNLAARTTHTGETPLHYAAAKAGCLATVVSLLKLGAVYDEPNYKGCSPAEVALQAHNIYAAVAIINAARGKRSKLVKEKEKLFRHVEKAKNRFWINDLIADIFSASCGPDSTVIVGAINKDDAGLVDVFFRKGTDPNRDTMTRIQPVDSD